MPTLRAGQIVVVVKIPIKLNRLVVARTPGREIIKRVVGFEDGVVCLSGDNQASNAYRVLRDQILGCVVYPLRRSKD